MGTQTTWMNNWEKVEAYLQASHDWLGRGQDMLITGEGSLHQQLNTPVSCTNRQLSNNQSEKRHEGKIVEIHETRKVLEINQFHLCY